MNLSKAFIVLQILVNIRLNATANENLPSNQDKPGYLFKSGATRRLFVVPVVKGTGLVWVRFLQVSY